MHRKPERPDPDECVVRLWEGYISAQFSACRLGSEEAFLCSPKFRTWSPPWEARVPVEELPAAASAFESLVVQLSRRGWRSAGAFGAWWEHVFVRAADAVAPMNGVGPALIADDALLAALARVADASGATAAELGRALYGDDPDVPNLPQRIGTRLRALQLHGRVERQEGDGVTRWVPVGAEGERETDADLPMRRSLETRSPSASSA